jgi:CelD/BcsL family acetyltransferase involved in cellulose biosynthesis
METFEIDPLRDTRWATLVDAHPDGAIYHRPEWLRALRQAYDYEPVVVTTSPPSRGLEDGIVFCRIRSPLTGARLVSVPFSDHCQPLIGTVSRFQVLLARVLQEIDSRKWDYVELRPVTAFPELAPKFNACHEYLFHRLDLSPNEQALFKSFHKDGIQRKVRRAEREGLRYEDVSTDRHLSDFYKLMVMTRRRHRLPPQPIAWFRSLIETFGGDLKIRLAYRGDKPIASIVTINHRKTMVYKYGCSDARFNNLGGTPFLFWRAIQEAKVNGFEELDLGRSDLDNPGLATFKDHWGAKRSTLTYWRYPAQAINHRPESAIRYFKKLLAIAPDASLILMGRLLYRHIG